MRCTNKVGPRQLQGMQQHHHLLLLLTHSILPSPHTFTGWKQGKAGVWTLSTYPQNENAFLLQHYPLYQVYFWLVELTVNSR